jgi:NADP-reducing hydrogenase subunit HndB
MCQKEPLLDVARPGEDRVTYGPVMPTDVSRIITEHIVNGNIVEDLVIAKIPSKA